MPFHRTKFELFPSEIGIEAGVEFAIAMCNARGYSWADEGALVPVAHPDTLFVTLVPHAG